MAAAFRRENVKIYFWLLVSSLVLIAFFVAIDKAIFSKQLSRTSLDVAIGKSLEREKVFQQVFLRAQFHIQALRESPLFRRLLATGDVDAVKPLFEAVARSDATIMQARYIDGTGWERIRVDRAEQGHAPFVIADERLQDKSKRAYFFSERNRQLESMWFSDVDLNVEHGEVEVPFKPTLRAILPVSHDGEFAGIIVINYFMREFLENFIKTGIFDVYLIDGQLNTLVHPESRKSWSRYQDQPYLISARFPGLAKIVNGTDGAGENVYVKRLDLPVGPLYAVFAVKQDYIRSRQSIENERIVILVVSLLMLSIVISVFLTRIVRGLVSDIDERKKLYALLQKRTGELEQMTVTDPLTGVYNRRYFDARIAAAINSAKRDDRLLNLAILDIDYFKQYNDSHGHQAGDRVLVAVGELLNTMLKRADDCGFRLGGEEFAMLLNNKSKADAMRFVEQVRQALEGLRITHERSDVSPFVTASFGLVSIPASQAGGFDDLYQMADRLLYEAKRAGRNKVVSN